MHKRLGPVGLCLTLLLLFLAACGPSPEGTGPLPGTEVPTAGPIDAADPAPLRLSEVVTKNSASGEAPDGGLYDWIELCNPSPSALDLGGVSLSDDPDEPGKFTFGPGTVLEAGGYLTVYATGKSGAIGAPNAPFKLSSDGGETLRLSAPDGRVLDEVTLPALAEDEGYGRVSPEGDLWAYLDPTPGRANGNVRRLSILSCSFSHESGFYDEPFSLSATWPEGCTLYYTADTTTPGTGSLPFSAPLRITDVSSRPDVFSSIVVTGTEAGMFYPDAPTDKATVLRFVLSDGHGHLSDVKTVTYFVGYGAKDGYDDLAVVSLVTDPAHLWDDTCGIFVNGNWNKRGIDWERPVTLSFFDEEGTYVFSQDCGVRIHGSSTRAYQQKSLTLYARDRYGSDEFGYTFFDGVDYLKSFCLRYDCSLKFHEGFLSELAAGQGFATAKSRPCAVFLDGEYYGIYTLIERFTKQYVETHYGIDRDNVVIIKKGALEEGTQADLSTYNSFVSFVTQSDMSRSANYTRACQLMDMEGFVDYLCFQIWCGNEDWSLKQNIACFRARTPDPANPWADGKWRFMLYDLDFCIGIWSRAGNYYSYDTDTYTAPMPFAGPGPLENPLVKSLWKSADFRAAVARRMAEVAETVYAPERAVALLTAYENVYAPNMANYYRRFGDPGMSEAEYRDCMEGFKNYFRRRPDYILPLTETHTGFSVTAGLWEKAGEGRPKEENA